MRQVVSPSAELRSNRSRVAFGNVKTLRAYDPSSIRSFAPPPFKQVPVAVGPYLARNISEVVKPQLVALHPHSAYIFPADKGGLISAVRHLRGCRPLLTLPQRSGSGKHRARGLRQRFRYFPWMRPMSTNAACTEQVPLCVCDWRCGYDPPKNSAV